MTSTLVSAHKPKICEVLDKCTQLQIASLLLQVEFITQKGGKRDLM